LVKGKYFPQAEIRILRAAQGIEAEIPQGPDGGLRIGADSPVSGREAAGNAPRVWFIRFAVKMYGLRVKAGPSGYPVKPV
jgi:hypothetical protein